VYTPEGVLCDPFVTASLLYNIHDYNHLVTAARIVGAVGKAAKNLVQYYQKRNGTCDLLLDGECV
jgi:hypothetical protein